jgi:hypothetical protein
MSMCCLIFLDDAVVHSSMRFGQLWSLGQTKWLVKIVQYVLWTCVF